MALPGWLKPKIPSPAEQVGEMDTVGEDTPLIHPARQSKIICVPEHNIASAYDDGPSQRTLSRRISNALSKFSWYYKGNNSHQVSLDDAWAYFEHTTLARYNVNESCRGGKDYFVRAEPGETSHPTQLYPVVGTPETDLADWGIGVGIYFFTLRMLSFIMLVAGILSFSNLWYFYGDEYNSAEEFAYSRVMRSSAVCTDQAWRACPNCTMSQWDHFPATFNRYAEAYTEDGKKLTFIKANACTISGKAGLVACGAMLFVCISILILSRVIREKQNEFDESQQTTSDYSIVVRNPPLDAKDPEEWCTFFKRFGHVTAVTIALDNHELLHKLVKRRNLVSKLTDLLPFGEEVDPTQVGKAVEKAFPVPWYRKVIGGKDAKTLEKKIRDIDETIQSDLSMRDYVVSDVFVTFEDEASQQEALRAHQVPFFSVYRNNLEALSSGDLAFRGQHVLSVQEPPEPSSVRWQDLNEKWFQQVKQQLVTYFITFILILCCCLLISFIKLRYGVVYGAVAVSAVTSLAPKICKAIIMCGESHASEGGRQVSLYCKNTAFLWVTTTFLTAVITPFVETLNNANKSLIPAMYAIFITEMLKAPVIQATDLVGNFKKHILAPRARNQKQMSQYFRGKDYDIASRYTDLTNVLFLTFYYSMLFPAGYFLASATLAVHYWVDKFSLLRVWARAPIVGNEIAEMNRTYFFGICLVVYALMSSYSFASFPYDNACSSDTEVSSDYVGYFNATTGDGESIAIDVTNNEKNYYFCNQDLVLFVRPDLPAITLTQLGSEWMTPEQRDVAQTVGLASSAVVICVLAVILNHLRKKLWGFFVRPFQSHLQRTSPQKFSDAPGISAYIPQASLKTLPFPVLFCDIRGIERDLMPWSDPRHPDYNVHNAIFDLPGLADKPVFSSVHHWPAKTKQL